MVIEEKVNDINASSRDISEKLKQKGIDVSNDTVCDIINDDLPQLATESTAVADLVTRNNNLQSAADALIAEMIANKDESITIAQLSTLRESTFKQNQLIEGKSTENNKVTIEWSV